ncbi:MAG: hypothetical protein ACK559_19100 [bacterium]|jgi:hypothetical protein
MGRASVLVLGRLVDGRGVYAGPERDLQRKALTFRGPSGVAGALRCRVASTQLAGAPQPLFKPLPRKIWLGESEQLG